MNRVVYVVVSQEFLFATAIFFLCLPLKFVQFTTKPVFHNFEFIRVETLNDYNTHIYVVWKNIFSACPGQTQAKKQNRVEKCDIPLSTALQRERERESERDPPLIVCCRHSTGSWVTGKNHIYCPSKQPAWRTSLMNIRKERVSRPCATFRLNLVNY